MENYPVNEELILERILSLIPNRRGAQKEFAERLEINESAIADWKAHRVKSYMNYIYKIAYLYDVSAEWLRGKTEDRTPPHHKIALTENEKQLLELYRKLPQVEQMRVIVGLNDMYKSSSAESVTVDLAALSDAPEREHETVSDSD